MMLLPCCQAQPQMTASSFERHTYQVWNTSTGLPQDTVRQFLQTRDGYVWMATDGGLVRYDGFDFATFDRRNTPQMQSDLVNGLFEDGTGSLWLATSNGLVRMQGNHFSRYAMAEGLPSDSVLSVRQDQQGRICAVTAGGPACLDGRGSSTHFTASRQASVGVIIADPREKTLSVTSPLDHTEWKVNGGRLQSTRDGRTTDVSLPDGFSGSDILTLYADREGNLWVGSENAGAAIVRTPPFTTLGRKDGLAADQVRSLLQDSRGDLWFGTGSGLTRLHDGTFTTIGRQGGGKKPALASDEIIALAGRSADDLWAGTPDGLSHLQGAKITTLTASDGLPDDNIRSLLEARDGSLWIGTTHGLAHLQRPHGESAITAGDIHTYTTADGLASNVIGALLENADGSLWVGTRGGLSHVQGGAVTTSSAARSAIITALGKDESGTLWVGTAGAGLLGKDTAGVLPDTIYSVLDDERGNIWLSSPDGIYRVAESDLHGAAQPAITRYDVADGLRINDCGSGGHPEAIRTTDGHLLFATSKGVSVVNAADTALRQTAPPVVLEAVNVDDANAAEDDASTQQPERSLHVAAGHERLAFHYAGVNFAAPSKVRYRYQLEEFDRHWIDAGTRRTAYYTNIPPGRYRFRVQASINSGAWSERAAEIRLVIAPHYYQTWWFYMLIALMLALLAWQLYLYRLRQVELRFNAVLAERGRIAREIHDTLAQDIVAISVQLDLVSRLMTLSIDKAREQLVATRTLVRKSLAEARSSIWDLRSGAATGAAGNDLPTRIRETTRQVVGDAPLKLNLVITGTYRQAPRELEDELLRIAQEAVTNAVRHAAPQCIDVSLTYQARGVDLRVKDDGRGFATGGEKAGPAGHYGIRGMHERAERAGARLTIESSPGGGTTVLAQAEIP
jgi:ligand-binding sensor domain-containing protein/two-component sensor histidine kinase